MIQLKVSCHRFIITILLFDIISAVCAQQRCDFGPCLYPYQGSPTGSFVCRTVGSLKRTSLISTTCLVKQDQDCGNFCLQNPACLSYSTDVAREGPDYHFLYNCRLYSKTLESQGFSAGTGGVAFSNRACYADSCSSCDSSQPIDPSCPAKPPKQVVTNPSFEKGSDIIADDWPRTAKGNYNRSSVYTAEDGKFIAIVKTDIEQQLLCAAACHTYNVTFFYGYSGGKVGADAGNAPYIYAQLGDADDSTSLILFDQSVCGTSIKTLSTDCAATKKGAAVYFRYTNLIATSLASPTFKMMYIWDGAHDFVGLLDNVTVTLVQ